MNINSSDQTMIESEISKMNSQSQMLLKLLNAFSFIWSDFGATITLYILSRCQIFSACKTKIKILRIPSHDHYSFSVSIVKYRSN